MVQVYTFGDSHATHHGSWDKVVIPGANINVQKFSAGRLMHSFGRDKDKVIPSAVAEGSILIFCYGEIDCRMHISNYKDDWQQNVVNVVGAYFENIQLNVSSLNLEKVYPMVYNVTPTWEPLHAHKNGTAPEILEYTKFMNSEIEKRCKEYGYTFFNVYDKYADSRGYLLPQYTDKICHINDPIHIQEFLANFIDSLGE